MGDEEEMTSEEIKLLEDLTEKIKNTIPNVPEKIFVNEVRRV